MSHAFFLRDVHAIFRNSCLESQLDFSDASYDCDFRLPISQGHCPWPGTIEFAHWRKRQRQIKHLQSTSFVGDYRRRQFDPIACQRRRPGLNADPWTARLLPNSKICSATVPRLLMPGKPTRAIEFVKTRFPDDQIAIFEVSPGGHYNSMIRQDIPAAIKWLCSRE